MLLLVSCTVSWKTGAVIASYYQWAGTHCPWTDESSERHLFACSPTEHAACCQIERVYVFYGLTAICLDGSWQLSVELPCLAQFFLRASAVLQYTGVWPVLLPYHV
jgi:hypothetical protein